MNRETFGWCRIGLHDVSYVSYTGNFTWVDGTPLDYTNWYPGNPALNPSDHGVVLTDFDDKTWYMADDLLIYDAICAYYL